MSLDDFKREVGKKKEIEERYKLYTLAELVPLKAESILMDNENPLTTGFQTFDEITKYKMRGKLIFHIGYGGTKKSLSCLQGMLSSYAFVQSPSIYSNMEMANVNLLDRVLDLSFSTDYKMSERFENDILDESIRHAAIITLQQQLNSHFSNKLKINGTNGMTVNDYSKLMDIFKSETGEEISQLIIDGMSMTGGVGTETERMDTNSKELKALANERYVAINAIVHCAKSSGGRAGTLHTRDLKPYIRGSEKLADNCDRYYMYSLCEDEMKGEGYYKPNYGWIRLVDKRGTGRIKDLIYEFNPMTLRMEETDIEPHTMEIKQSKNGF